MLHTIKKVTAKIVGGANIASILVMLAVGYSDHLNPLEHHLLSQMGLTFPIFLFINLCFLLFWLLFYRRGVWIAVAGLLLCYVPVRKYTPINMPVDPPQGSIKFLSYNLLAFSSLIGEPDGYNPALRYISTSGADIICLQEGLCGGVTPQELDSAMASYAYHDSTPSNNKNDLLRIYSRYPILRRQRIQYASNGNLSMAYWLHIGRDTVIVINNHFESNGLNKIDKDGFKSMVKGKLETDSVKRESRRLLDKLITAGRKRAPQAEAVARFIAQHKGTSMIVCGDFNDTPISYTHRTVARGLTDCYVASGLGPGISYHLSGFYVRIDNILCTPDWKPYGCKIDNKIGASDHYPIYCWLKKTPIEHKKE